MLPGAFILRPLFRYVAGLWQKSRMDGWKRELSVNVLSERCTRRKRGESVKCAQSLCVFHLAFQISAIVCRRLILGWAIKLSSFSRIRSKYILVHFPITLLVLLRFRKINLTFSGAPNSICIKPKTTSIKFLIHESSRWQLSWENRKEIKGLPER